MKKICEIISLSKLLIVIMGIIIAILIMNTTCVNIKNEKLSNNIKSLLDTVNVLETKNGELIYAKQSLILEKNELEKYLDISKKERKDLEKQLNSSLAYIAKIYGSIKIDTLIMTDSVYINADTIKTIFNYKDNWVFLSGQSITTNSGANTQLNTLDMNIPLQLGIMNDYKVFVKSDNPYVNFSSIDAAAIEGTIANQKKKRWGIGPYIGVGVGAGTDFKGNPQFGWNISVGIAVTYSLFQW